MEPPFYAELNTACRKLSEEYLRTLGPYARAMYLVLVNGNYSEAKRNDLLRQGEQNGNQSPFG